MGTYSVIVSNSAGSITSSNAVLTIDTNGVAPVFHTEPDSQVVLIGGTTPASTQLAAGTAPDHLPVEQGRHADFRRDIHHVDPYECASYR